jgi:rubrerythrin
MIEREQLPSEDGGDYVAFHEAGLAAKGSFHCAECGYGVVVTGSLPACPMCGGTAWEESARSPSRRATPL